MQIICYVFRIIFLIYSLTVFISCSSSSYYERYGKYEVKTPAENKSSRRVPITRDNSVEDESFKLPAAVSQMEAKSILQQLSDVTGSNNKKKRFLNEIINYLNTPYRYGGETKRGIDCSAFTQKIYRNSLNVTLPRTAREQYRKWKIFKDKNNLKFGDLIYFDTSERYYPGHVGIYIDNSLFAHASSSKGVIFSSLSNNYYSSKFVGANRVNVKQ
jgi:cell wall-associated NlpC family hydrolase